MENNQPAQRTTICISEAFNFLESPEYGITDNTSPEIIIMKRVASESGIKGNNHVLNRENMPRKFNGFVSEQDKRSNQISDQNRDENVELQNHLENNLILDPKKGDNPSMEDNKCKGDNPIMEDNKFKGDNPTMEDNKCKGDNPSMEDNECKGGNLEQECNIGDNLVLEYNKRDNLAQNSTTSQNNSVVTGNDDCDSGYSNRSSFIDVESENSRKLLEASEDVNMFKVAVNSDCSTDTDTVNGDVNIVSNNSDQKHEKLVIQSSYYVENGKLVTQSSDYDENEKSVTHSSDYVENRKSVTHSSDSVVNGKSVTHSGDSVVNGQPVTHSSDYVVDGKSVTRSSDYVVPVNGCDDDKPLNVEEEEEAVRLRPKSVTSTIDHRRGTTQIVSDAFSFLKDVDIFEEVCNNRRSSGYKSSHFPDDDMLGVTNDDIDKSADYTYQVDNGKQTKGERSIDKGNNPIDQEVNKERVKSLKRQKSHKEMDEDQNSGDSSDEDTGEFF